jgi:hypothetical protein
MKRKTIGENPLDALVPPKEPAKSRVGPQAAKALRTPPRPRKAGRADSIFNSTTDKRPGKERLTVHVGVDVIDRAKNAVYWTPGLTLAGLAEDSLVKSLDKLEKDHGGPFPPRKSELKGGRPVK